MRTIQCFAWFVILLTLSKLTDSHAQITVGLGVKPEQIDVQKIMRSVPTADAAKAKSDLALHALRLKLANSGINAPTLAQTTWENLNGPARRELLSAYAKAIVADNLSPENRLNDLASATDTASKMAIIALSKKKLIDPRIISEGESGKLSPSLVAFQASLIRMGDQNLIIPKREFDTAPRKPRARAGCGNECAIVSPGTPKPQSPNTVLPIMMATASTNGTQGVLGMRRPRFFNPAGFLEVAIVDLPGGGNCTGTMLSEKIVLTAAHCVVGYSVDKLQVRLPIFDHAILDSCKHTLETAARYEQCVDFDLFKVKAAYSHSKYDTTKKINDVAYLELAVARQGAVTAIIEFRDAPPEFITMAGYGDNGLHGKRNLEMKNAIEVGWHIGGALSQGKGKIGWLYSPLGNDSASCSGDSGGPIYNGDYDGGAKDGPHRVFAITSTGTSQSCKDFFVQNTDLGNPVIRNWLCNQQPLRAIIASCTASTAFSKFPPTRLTNIEKNVHLQKDIDMDIVSALDRNVVTAMEHFLISETASSKEVDYSYISKLNKGLKPRKEASMQIFKQNLMKMALLRGQDPYISRRWSHRYSILHNINYA